MKKNHIINLSLLLFASFLLISNILNIKVTAWDNREVISGDFSYEGIIPANQNTSLYFSDLLSELNIISDVDVNISVDFAPIIPVVNRQIYIEINNTEPVSLTVDCIFNLFGFLYQLGLTLPNMPTLEDIAILYYYNCFYRIVSNVSIDMLTIKFDKFIDFGLNPTKEYLIASYKQGESSIELINTVEKTYESSSDTFIEGNITNVEQSTPMFFSVMETKPPSTYESNYWPTILSFVIPSFLIVISVVIVISKQEYINYLKTRMVSIDKTTHRLTLEEVLENENRSKILDLILEKPGIHFNELLRTIGLSPGNLVWHLDILQSYKIIGKKRFENLVVYFPYYQKNPLSNLDLKLQKSELTLKVLKIIEKNPGTWNNQIAKQLGINRKTIQYHVQKLIDLKLIFLEKTSSKNRIYLKIDKYM